MYWISWSICLYRSSKILRVFFWEGVRHLIFLVDQTTRTYPATTRQLPDNYPKLPETTRQLPDNYPNLPETTRQLPDNYPNLPDNYLKLPEIYPKTTRQLLPIACRILSRTPSFRIVPE